VCGVWGGGGGREYPCLITGRRKSSIVGNCFDTIPIPQLITAQAGEVLHIFVVCFTYSTATHEGTVDV